MKTILSLLSLVVLLGCGVDTAKVSGDDTGLDDGVEVVSSELSSAAILTFLNGPDATYEVLNIDVGIDARAARKIVDRVRGDDEQLGTADDQPLRSIEELDALPWVGPTALAAIDRYVLAHYAQPPPAGTITVEGVSFTPAEAAAAVAVCNDEAQLRAAAVTTMARSSLVSSGPHTTIEGVAAVPWVGPSTLERLKLFVTAPPAPPTGCSETAASHDGVAFTADEACRAVKFLNVARLSEMWRIPKGLRDFAYGGGPHPGLNGSTRKQFSTLAEFTAATGVGKTSVTALHQSIQGWAPNGLTWDTIASTWENRAALVDKPVGLDKVYVTRLFSQAVDPNRPWIAQECGELRDSPTASNYFTACWTVVGADSCTGCTCGGCWRSGAAGTWVGALGTVTQSGGSWRITLINSGLRPANPAVP